MMLDAITSIIVLDMAQSSGRPYVSVDVPQVSVGSHWSRTREHCPLFNVTPVSGAVYQKISSPLRYLILNFIVIPKPFNNVEAPREPRDSG